MVALGGDPKPENDAAEKLMLGLGRGSLSEERGGRMPRKGHSEEQIAYALRQAETG